MTLNAELTAPSISTLAPDPRGLRGLEGARGAGDAVTVEKGQRRIAQLRSALHLDFGQGRARRNEKAEEAWSSMCTGSRLSGRHCSAGAVFARSSLCCPSVRFGQAQTRQTRPSRLTISRTICLPTCADLSRHALGADSSPSLHTGDLFSIRACLSPPTVATAWRSVRGSTGRVGHGSSRSSVLVEQHSRSSCACTRRASPTRTARSAASSSVYCADHTPNV